MKTVTSLILTLFFSFSLMAQTVPTGLRTDLIERTDVVYSGGYPIGLTLIEAGLSKGEFQYAAIATPRPRFSWVVPAAKSPDSDETQVRMIDRDVMQSAYQIRLYRFAPLQAKAPAKGAKQYDYPMPEEEKSLVWDSGRVGSGQSTAVPYGGDPLEPDTIYGWEVKTWVVAGRPEPFESEWSEMKLFRTARELRDDAVSTEPLVKTDEHPVLVKKLPGGNVLADFGKAAFGQLRLKMRGATYNKVNVVLHLGERLKDGRVDREPFGTCRYRRIELTLLPGTQTYTPEILPDWRNTHGDAVLMPDYIGEVMPFRYLEIEGLPYPVVMGEDGVPHHEDPIRAEDIVRMTVTHPASNQDGSFSSSDRILNEVWDLCRYSMVATSFIGYHIDGDRERIPYECDALINQLGWYGVEGSYTLSRRTADYLLDHPTWPTEWILQTVLMAWYDFLYTGDNRLLEARYEILRNHTLSDLRQPNGLISTRLRPQDEVFLKGLNRTQPIRDIVDWPQGRGSFGLPDSNPGEADFFEFTDYNAVVNAYHFATLCAMARIAGALGRDEEYDRWTADAVAFKDRYNRFFLDRRAGTYRDGIGSDHSALHSNLFPLAFGLVPERRVPSVAGYIIGKGMACSIANAKFLLDALYEAGEADAALALLNATHDRSWYNAIRAGSTITFEAWDDKYKGNQDWNHAWGAAPADLLPHKLLGVEPLEPGWDRIRIRPQVASLTKVAGTVPTIKGPVSLSLEQDGTGCRLLLNLPSNTQSCVLIPWPKDKKAIVSLDGKPVITSRDVTGRYLVLDPVGSGMRLIEVH